MRQRSTGMDDSSLNKQTWQEIVAKYQNPQRAKSIGQLLNTLIPYVLLWVVMDKALSVSFWLMFDQNKLL